MFALFLDSLLDSWMAFLEAWPIFPRVWRHLHLHVHRGELHNYRGCCLELLQTFQGLHKLEIQIETASINNISSPSPCPEHHQSPLLLLRYIRVPPFWTLILHNNNRRHNLLLVQKTHISIFSKHMIRPYLSSLVIYVKMLKCLRQFADIMMSKCLCIAAVSP